MNADFRSDTITRPTPAMRDAIANAPVGDDVWGDDPSVNALQDRAAELFGKEAALFVPSGTMANQICVRAHTEPGDEIIVEADSHIFLYEGGAFAAISGVSIQRVPAERGIMTTDAIEAAIRPSGGMSHFPVSKLLCVENTANRGGGTIYPIERLTEIGALAKSHDLKLHLDGARVFNAAVAQKVPLAQIAAPFDSIACCLSKGLGCPVGSLILGSRALIDRAHRFRKMFGGGMRQSGLLAAAGLHAFDHHIDRLADDHARARLLAESLAALPGVTIDLASVETNMVYIDVSGTGIDATTFNTLLAERGVHMHDVSPTRLRAVTHLDLATPHVHAAIEAFTAITAP